MANTELPVPILITVEGATSEPVVSVIAMLGADEAAVLTGEIASSAGPGGNEFAFRVTVPAASRCIVVSGEFEFSEAGLVKVAISSEGAGSLPPRNLAVALEGGTAHFEAFHSLEGNAEPIESAKRVRGLRPSSRSGGSIADLIEEDDPAGEATETTRTLDPPQNVEVEVFFGTDRAAGEPDGAGVTFSTRRGGVLTVGMCKVRIPPSHRIGSTGSSFLKRLFGPDDRLKLIETRVSDVDAWTAALRARLASVASASRCGVVFVHGFNVSFRDAAIRCAQLRYDLSIAGPMAFFSWPSRGSVISYTADEATVETSEEYLFAFLGHFIEACAGAPVHVIAHSMGSRVLARTLVRLRNSHPGVSVDQLIFAAPDVDQDTFAALARQFRDVAKQATLYVSARDTAVELSRALHSAPRAGLYPPVTVLPGLDTVAVTNVDTSLLGHGYVAEAREVLHDMHSVLHFRTTPQQRMGLRVIATGGATHWSIGS